jgi:hypothetical protein
VAYVGDKKSVYRILVGKPEGERLKNKAWAEMEG